LYNELEQNFKLEEQERQMSDQTKAQEYEEQHTRAFNPNEHLMQIKSGQGSKDYLPVQWRLVWFRSICPNGIIRTEMVHLELDRETEEEVFVWNSEKRRSEKTTKHANGFVIFRAVVEDGKGGVATGTKTEKAASFPDFLEKAETGAIGRALAALGYGTQFAPELDEQHRIVDSPVERGAAPVESNGNDHKGIVAVRPSASRASSNGQQATAAASGSSAPNAPVTEQQLMSIRKLCEHLGKAEPEQVETLSFASAKELITQLSQEYRQSRSKAS